MASASLAGPLPPALASKGTHLMTSLRQQWLPGSLKSLIDAANRKKSGTRLKTRTCYLDSQPRKRERRTCKTRSSQLRNQKTRFGSSKNCCSSSGASSELLSESLMPNKHRSVAESQSRMKSCSLKYSHQAVAVHHFLARLSRSRLHTGMASQRLTLPKSAQS